VVDINGLKKLQLNSKGEKKKKSVSWCIQRGCLLGKKQNNKNKKQKHKKHKTATR